MTETVPEDVWTLAREVADQAPFNHMNMGQRQYLVLCAANAIMADRASRPAAIPEGWRLVPEEPTRDMVAAAFEARDHVAHALSRAAEGGFSSGVICAYRAMLAAAPSAPQASTTDAEPVVVDLLRSMEPHLDKLRSCVRINDEWGRVVTGQTEAIAALAGIFDRALAKHGGRT